MKKIDCHMHLVESIHGMGSKGILRDLGNGCGMYETGDIVRIIPEKYGSSITAPKVIKLMEKNDVEFCVVLQGHYAGMQNMYTYESMKRYPGKILGACMYDPFFKNSEAIKENLYRKCRFKITKMELSNSSGLMCNHEVFSINGKMMHDIYSTANEYNNIMYLDLGRPGNPCYQIKEARDAIKGYPNMTFIICHLTAPQAGDLELMKENLNLLKLPNCYFDIASLYNNIKDDYPHLETQKYIREAIDIVGSDKILWGSDFPSAMKVYDYEFSYKYIEESELFTLEEKENILYNNAYKIFKDLI